MKAEKGYTCHIKTKVPRKSMKTRKTKVKVKLDLPELFRLLYSLKKARKKLGIKDEIYVAPYSYIRLFDGAFLKRYPWVIDFKETRVGGKRKLKLDKRFTCHIKRP